MVGDKVPVVPKKGVKETQGWGDGSINTVLLRQELYVVWWCTHVIWAGGSGEVKSGGSLGFDS